MKTSKAAWKKSMVSLLTTGLLLSTVGAAFAEGPPVGSAAGTFTESAAVTAANNSIIVKFKPGASINSVKALSNQKIIRNESLPGIGARVIKLPEGANLDQILADLNKDPNVLYAEPNFRIQMAAPELGPVTVASAVYDTVPGSVYGDPEGDPPAGNDPGTPEVPGGSNGGSPGSGPDSGPNDPKFEFQWGLQNIGQELPIYEGEASTAAGFDIDAVPAWEKAGDAQKVIVAVLDSGVDITTDGLQGKMWTNPNETSDGTDGDGDGLIGDIHGWDFANNDATLFDLLDGTMDFQGTSLATAIASHINDGIGIAGVAPNVEMMSVKIIGRTEGGDIETVIKGIHYAEEHGAQIVVQGWSVGWPSKALEEAISSSKMLFSVPAGDSGDGVNLDAEPNYPAGYHLPNVITTNALHNQGYLFNMTNYGAGTVDLTAPGANVLAEVPHQKPNYAAQIDNGIYRAAFNGFSLSQIYDGTDDGSGDGDGDGGIGIGDGGGIGIGFGTMDAEPEFPRQILFKRAMDYLLEDKPNKKVLLVQDDKSQGTDPDMPVNSPNLLSVYDKLFKETFGEDFTYDLKVVNVGESGPSAEDMGGYDVVVWFTGIGNGSINLTGKDLKSLTGYLEGGGRLYLSGQEILDGNQFSPFALDVLHLYLMGSKTYGEVNGEPGTLYDGFGFDWMYKFNDYLNAVQTTDPSITKNALSTDNDPYYYITGSHIAAAYTAGVAAMVEGKYPDLTAEQVKQRLLGSVTPVDFLQHVVKSGGLLNANRALSDDDIPGINLLESSVSKKLDAAANPDDVYAVDLYAGQTLTASLSGEAGTDFDLQLFGPDAASIHTDAPLAVSKHAGTSAETITFKISQTGTYYLNVHAATGSGKYKLTIDHENGPGTYQSNDASLVYSGDWQSKSGGIRELAGKGNVELTFNGSQFSWYGVKDSNQGFANVYVDGYLLKSVSLYSAERLEDQLLYKKSLVNGTHTVVIERTGTPGKTGSKAANINLSKLVIVNKIEELYPSVSYTGAWMTSVSAKHSGGSARYTTQTGASSAFTFEGREAVFYANTSNNRGIVNLYIDDQFVTSLDLYSEGLKYQVPVYRTPVLEKGTHTLKIVNSGKSRADSKGNMASVDGLTVIN